jgi:hypothetical protein
MFCVCNHSMSILTCARQRNSTWQAIKKLLSKMTADISNGVQTSSDSDSDSISNIETPRPIPSTPFVHDQRVPVSGSPYSPFAPSETHSGVKNHLSAPSPPSQRPVQNWGSVRSSIHTTAKPMTSTVPTECGNVRGVQHDGLRIFKGTVLCICMKIYFT